MAFLNNYLIVDNSDMMHNLVVLITLILSATRGKFSLINLNN